MRYRLNMLFSTTRAVFFSSLKKFSVSLGFYGWLYNFTISQMNSVSFYWFRSYKLEQYLKITRIRAFSFRFWSFSLFLFISKHFYEAIEPFEDIRSLCTQFSKWTFLDFSFTFCCFEAFIDSDAHKNWNIDILLNWYIERKNW